MHNISCTQQNMCTIIIIIVNLKQPLPVAIIMNFRPVTSDLQYELILQVIGHQLSTNIVTHWLCTT